MTITREQYLNPAPVRDRTGRITARSIFEIQPHPLRDPRSGRIMPAPDYNRTER